MANKYTQKGPQQGHNGTINGVHGKRRARQDRATARGTSTASERLERLDAGNYAAKRERRRLEVKLKNVR